MKKAKFKIIISYRSWIQFFFIIFLSFPLNVWGQIGGESIVEKLIDMGFENVRWIDWHKWPTLLSKMCTKSKATCTKTFKFLLPMANEFTTSLAT